MLIGQTSNLCTFFSNFRLLGSHVKQIELREKFFFLDEGGEKKIQTSKLNKLNLKTVKVYLDKVSLEVLELDLSIVKRSL